ncbi:MAG: helix-turn-helix domain-containing protein [Acidimicrobiales bacterium]
MARHRVVASLSPYQNPFELAVACEVFGLPRPELGVEWYDFTIARTDPGPVRMVGGMTVTTEAGVEAFADADTIVIPNAPTSGPGGPPEFLAALRTAHARGARLVSYCSGAFALADAGLLDRRPATTHWKYAARLTQRFPEVDLRPGVLYVDDGQILTSAGTAAAIDVSLHIVRQDHGAEVANGVARSMVVPPHRDGGQAQYIARPVPETPETGNDLAPVLDWILAHLDHPLTVDEMATRALMSPRTFARRFAADVGGTPLQWLLRQRVHRAQELLETTELGLDHVADACGFGSAATLRVHFQRVVGTSPGAYRRTFRQSMRSA